MFRDVNRMEASSMVYVKFGTFDEVEQSRICVLTVTTMGIVMLTALHHLILSICFMKDPGDIV
jgi:hypothetical protein